MRDLKQIFKKKYLPLDKFFEKVLYDKKIGYYNNSEPFNKKGDYITSPNISVIFSEIISIWLMIIWKKMGKPKKINFIELGPGNGEMAKIILQTAKGFPKFFSSLKMNLIERSERLLRIQKKNLKNYKVQWISSPFKIGAGPVILIGNEFFDAIPIKQFKKVNGTIYEKFLYLDKNKKISDKFLKVNKKTNSNLKSFRTIKFNNFFEFPHEGLKFLNKVCKLIKNRGGVLLLIDYGYTTKSEINTLQSIKNHSYNNLFENITKADVSSLVNFKLLKEYFLKQKLKVSKINTQGEFLKSYGIIERANLMSKKMTFKEKTDLYYRINRLINSNQMGNLFKVICAYDKKFK